MNDTPQELSDRKLALVTGGTRGIGAAIGRALIADGFQLVAFYHSNHERAGHFAAETGATTYSVNVSHFDDVQHAVHQVEEAHGPIHTLVNNAGVVRDSMAHKMAMDDWHHVLDTNLSACFYLCRAVLGGMRQRGCGRIINMSSINGQKGQLGQVNYAAAKAGVLGFTKALALENAAKGICVNAICPGYIKTEMTAEMNAAILDQIIANIPTNRLGCVEEVADIVAFLASDKASFINGATFNVNGGQYMG